MIELLQTPLTTTPIDFWQWLFNNKVWNDSPLVFITFAVLILCALAARWFWSDFKKESERARVALVDAAEKDRIWREQQNDKREAAQDSRDQKWRDAIAQQYSAVARLATSMEGIATQLKEHDQRAEKIGHMVNRVEENTRPLKDDPGYERRHNE